MYILQLCNANVSQLVMTLHPGCILKLFVEILLNSYAWVQEILEPWKKFWSNGSGVGKGQQSMGSSIF